MDRMREMFKREDIDARFNSCKSVFDSVTHTHSSRLPAVHLILSHPPFSLSSLSLALSLSLVSRVQVCESQQRLCASLSVWARERLRAALLQGLLVLSLFTHAHPVHPDRGLSFTVPDTPSAATSVWESRTERRDFYPGSFRDLQQHAPAEPDFIPRLSGALQQATREEWITERAGRGTEGLLCAFASSEDAWASRQDV